LIEKGMNMRRKSLLVTGAVASLILCGVATARGISINSWHGVAAPSSGGVVQATPADITADVAIIAPSVSPTPSETEITDFLTAAGINDLVLSLSNGIFSITADPSESWTGLSGPAAAPEIDPASTVSALTLLLGALAAVRGRSRRAQALTALLPAP
jgi:hypothetical protein